MDRKELWLGGAGVVCRVEDLDKNVGEWRMTARYIIDYLCSLFFVSILILSIAVIVYFVSARGDRMKQAQTDADELISAYRLEQQEAFDKAASADGKIYYIRISTIECCTFVFRCHCRAPPLTTPSRLRKYYRYN